MTKVAVITANTCKTHDTYSLDFTSVDYFLSHDSSTSLYQVDGSNCQISGRTKLISELTSVCFWFVQQIKA